MGKRRRWRKCARSMVSGILSVILAVVFCIGDISFTKSQGVLAAEGGKIDVWDFGAVEETDSQLYANHITQEDWNTCENVSDKGTFTAGTTTFGDLTITHNANDRLYSASTKNYGTSGLASTAYEDGYVAAGMYYCNGTGGPTRRYLSIEHVEAGDKINVYMAASNSASDNVCFLYIGDDGTQEDQQVFSNQPSKITFVAKYSGTYKIYTTTDGSAKPCFNRVERVPGVQVKGTVSKNKCDISDYHVLFTNNTTGVTTEAVLDGEQYTVVLAAGFTYTASLSMATGFGFTNATKQVTVGETDFVGGKQDVQLDVEPKSVYHFTGKITGIDAGYDRSGLSITMKAPEDSLADDVTMDINDDLSFDAVLEPDVTYTVELAGINDYRVVTGGTIYDNQNHVEDIQVGRKPVYEVSGAFTGLDDQTAVTSLKFVNTLDQYEYEAQISGNGYHAQLRDGSYVAVAVVNGYNTKTHVVVNGGSVTKDLLFVSEDTTIKTIPRVADIYVGYPEKENNYETVGEAVAACQAMNPQSEDERVTVHIKPGTYREQIIINTPYLSFVNDEQGEVLLTWYYGIGYEYYSADQIGYYNTENAYDKYDKQTAAKWGCSTYLQNGAMGFRASGITFEASFNRYLTDEELEDGVTPSENGTISFERKYGADVTSRTATERSAAMAVEADQVSFQNCTFLGGQDTLYTGAGNNSSYYKNCKIEGNTDFIFGDGNVVFDGCNLSWKGYSDKAYAGVLTAAKDTAQYGYLFRNCTVTGNQDLNVGGGSFGRPWGAGAKVIFMNTKLAAADLIADAGWDSMSGKNPENANFGEYHTTVTDGSQEDISGRVTGVMTDEQAQNINVRNYFGVWTPACYEEETELNGFVTAPSVTDNGDINTPFPGHTLKVHYSLGEDNDKSDASVIRWYRVNDDQTETLVKSATANSDTTYQISSEDTGCHIKVVVVPELLSGKTGEAGSYMVEEKVRDGYEDPGTGSDINIGDGINIFLAGDSTVKDYSAQGMYMSGKAQALGSWGEFLQQYFDSDAVTVQNFANGGRSSRNFLNEGSLDKISENIGEGDYLMIQFGHNDCANQAGYLVDRYVPLGEPDENGIYPVTAGTKVTTPASYQDKYGDSYYSYDCGGTYKWYLLQYINAAREKGATPILVTPVSRLYYDANGKIRSHHDSTDTTTGTQITENDAYVTAVRQLAEEENVMLVDAFSMTKDMYETAYENDAEAANGTSKLGNDTMGIGDKTHSNKLNGIKLRKSHITENVVWDFFVKFYMNMY